MYYLVSGFGLGLPESGLKDGHGKAVRQDSMRHWQKGLAVSKLDQV
jgi:hypothetical protein